MSVITYDSVRIEKLESGVTIATDYMPNVESVSLDIYVKVGGSDENISERGISHFVEHMVFKGTARRDKLKIATELDELGGHFNASTSKERTNYYGTTPSIYFKDMFDIFADIILNPSYDPEEIDRERGVIIQEIGMYEDDPQEKLSDQYYKTCFKDQAFGDSILGPVENIKNFKREDFLNYISRFYYNNNIIICAAGNVQFEELKELTQKYFNKNPNQNTIKVTSEVPIFTTGECRINKPDLEQVQIIIGFPGVKKDPNLDFLQMDVAGSILGGGMSSRLFQNIRETRGLAYSVSAWHHPYRKCGIFSIYGGVEPAKSNLFIEESIREMKKMRDCIEEKELERIKKQLECSILISTDGTRARVTHLSSSLANYGRFISPKELLNKIKCITLSDIKNSIDSVLNSKEKVIASIGNIEKNVMDFGEFESHFVS